MTSISDAKAVEGRFRFPDAPMPWEAHLAPQFVFSHPDDVLTAPYLGEREKRAILTSWASERFTVPNCPSLRRCPGLKGKFVPLRWIKRALAALDQQERSRHVSIGPREGDLPFRARARLRGQPILRKRVFQTESRSRQG